MRKLKHKSYYDEIYSVMYVFLLNVKDDKEVEKTLKKHYPQTYKFYSYEKNQGSNVSIEKSAGKNIRDTNRQIIMVAKLNKNYTESEWYGVLVHECLHAMMDVFEKRKVFHETDSHNEHWTYYLESLVRIALDKKTNI